MASKKNRARAVQGRRPPQVQEEDQPLVIEKVEYVDYKDVDLLRRFMSDRAKIRNRRVSGNDVQQQRDIANAIKIAREMALLPYAKRVVQPAQPDAPPRDGASRRPRRSRRERDTDAIDDRGRRDRGRRPTSRGRRRRASRPTRRSDDEGHPPLRPRRARQARRHRRGRRRLRPQLPAARGAWPSRPPTARSTRPAKMRRARDLRDASDREAAQTIATHARAEGHHDHGQGRQRGQAVRLGHRRRHRRRRRARRPASSSTASSSTSTTDQDARRAHGDRQAAHRRVVPDHASRSSRPEHDRPRRHPLRHTRRTPVTAAASPQLVHSVRASTRRFTRLRR